LSNGIKEVLIPKGNEKDIAELPDIVKDGLIITPVKTMDEVLAKALV
jgi:endopeptidase La